MRRKQLSAPEVLKEAAQIIEEHGWVQGKPGRPGEGYCMVGAIQEVSGFTPCLITAVGLVRSITQEDLAYWNDQPGRTKEEVLHVLRKAAE